MTRSRLTQEDVEFLEQQLERAFTPVAPRRDFVERARLEIMRQPSQRRRLERQQIAALVGVATALLGLISVLVCFARRRA